MERISQQRRRQLEAEALDEMTGLGNGLGREKRRGTSMTAASSSSSSTPVPSSRKLRASCDSCFHAKIRCSKEKPCRRCANHGTECVYSPSQRTGKPRKFSIAVTAAATSTHSQSHMPSPATTTQDSPRTQSHLPHESASTTLDSYAGEQSGNNPFLEWPFTLTPPTSDADPSDSTMAVDLRPFAWQQNLQGPAEPSYRPHSPDSTGPAQKQAAPANLSHSHQWPTQRFEPLAKDFTLLQPSSSSPHTSTPQLPSPTTPTTLITCNCTTTAYETFRTLQERSTSTTTPFDMIMATNKDTLARIASLLTCGVCAATMDATLIMMLASTITKMLSWYASSITRDSRPAATHTTYKFDELTRSTQGHKRPPNIPQKEETQSASLSSSTPRTPIILGAYRLDSSDEEMIKTHVVLSELRKVDQVLLQFGKRFQNTLQGTTGKRDSAAQECAFYTEVIVFLRRKLREVVEGLQKEVRVDFADV